MTRVSTTGVATAQDLPRVSASRLVTIGGIVADPHKEDVLGLSRIKYHGLIAGELASVGYHVVEAAAVETNRDPSHPPLNLIGMVKEEICDDQLPRQCRLAIQWELQDRRGVVVYRATTRAVDQTESLDKERRDLVQSAVRSLLQRRRFALQLTIDQADKRDTQGPFGFKRCARNGVALPQGVRSAAAALVLVESGSRLSGGAIISPDGLILTTARSIEVGAPLRVRFAARQTLPAQVVALEHHADVALLHVDAHLDATCAPLRETPLAEGSAVFGVSSPPSEDGALSLTESVVQKSSAEHDVSLLRVDSRIAGVDGAPLFDDQGRVAAVVSAELARGLRVGMAAAVDARVALEVLQIKAAAVTDPRLVDVQQGPQVAVTFVRDADDPPFTLGRRYTYGTSPAARTLRRLGLGSGVAGAVGVFATWSAFRTSRSLSPGAYNRLVVLNDVSWVLLSAGAVGFGVSYTIPEGHDVVAVESAARRQLFFGLGPAGLELRGRL